MTNNVKTELESFWKWANITPEAYAKDGWKNTDKEYEFLYPNWDVMFKKTIDLIRHRNKTEEDYNCILEVMALDHDVEMICEKCGELLSDKDLESLIKYGIKHIQPNARWQLASLIGEKGNTKLEEYLLLLLDDQDKYVQRRALISYTKLNLKAAEDVLFSRLTDEDDYIRMVSLRMLREINSSKLSGAVNVLKDDKFEFIIEEIESIRNNTGEKKRIL